MNVRGKKRYSHSEQLRNTQSWTIAIEPLYSREMQGKAHLKLHGGGGGGGAQKTHRVYKGQKKKRVNGKQRRAPFHEEMREVAYNGETQD